jgi:hypothetical protein
MENVRISHGGSDVGVIESALDQLKIAGPAKQLGGEVMAKVLNTEVARTRLFDEPLPGILHAAFRNRIALSPNATVASFFVPHM